MTQDELEREELLKVLEGAGGMPRPKSGNTGITGGMSGGIDVGGVPGGPRPGAELPLPGSAAAGAVAEPDRSAWNTDGYAGPKVTAGNPFGAVGGFDSTKWADPNHQTPKYVVGRILQEASGGSGNLADPEQRKAGIAKVLEAYPGSTYNGKDKITFPDGGTVDVFEGAGAGRYGIAWMPETGPGGAPLPDGGGARAGGMGLTPAAGSTFEGIQGLMPTDTDFYRKLQDEVQRTLGGPQALERDELLRLLGAGR